MSADFQLLSEREKQALRLLTGGHDAKSIARELGLSVHSVNDRLREVRRKLGTSSSREAARRLAEHEATPEFFASPEFSAPNRLGGASPPPPVPDGAAGIPASPPPRGSGQLFWIATGITAMSLLVAVLALSSSLLSAGPADAPAPAATAPAPAVAADPAEAGAALAWLALADAGSWDESWRAAGSLFQTKVTAAQWAGAAAMARNPLGRVVSRTVFSVMHADALPGAPAGRYTVLQYRTDFANKRDSVETLTLVREGDAWKTIGYFVR